MTTSGAYVRTFPGDCEKFSHVDDDPVTDRVNEQSCFLTSHQDIVWLPRVHETYHGGYSMELLYPLPEFVDDRALTKQIVRDLEVMWKRKHMVHHTFNPIAHRKYVWDRTQDSRMLDWFTELEWTIWRLPRCLVHGDPTWDNCMLDCMGNLVITDPLPPGQHLPSVRALDIAKIIQSIVGYEEVAKGRRATTLRVGDIRQLIPMDDAEYQVCLYLTALHLYRLVPYTTSHAATWRAAADHILTYGRTDSWMR